MDEAGLEQVLRQAASGETAALHRLVDEYSPRLYGLLYRLTSSRDAAEDLLQATFLRMVRMLPVYRHNGKFDAWLFRIAANLVRDRARKLERQRRAYAAEFGARLAEGLGPARHRTVVAPPDEQLMGRESGERLQRGLEKLSEPEREIILLRHFSELSFKEIAEMLGVPLGTALARAHRALAKLREQLGDSD